MAEEGQVNRSRALMGRTASWSLGENMTLLQISAFVDTVCVCATTQPMLTYVNSSERKREGAGMTELLSKLRNSPLPGLSVSRKWHL